MKFLNLGILLVVLFAFVATHLVYVAAHKANEPTRTVSVLFVEGEDLDKRLNECKTRKDPITRCGYMTMEDIQKRLVKAAKAYIANGEPQKYLELKAKLWELNGWK